MQQTWRIKDRLVTTTLPAVMGIINATPDSFHAASRADVDGALRLAERMILDVGGQSTRPGSDDGTAYLESARVLPVIEAIHQRFPAALISVDTWRAVVASEAVAAGASLVNDIGAGLRDAAMLPTVARLGVPYVAMHMQG
ncbi:MAG TPA: dihydropteroate synthase, partial [Flavobacteriales bacterium]|nr:dihydropteroate synthase [Flavobacteriales bacterium]